MIIFRSKLGIYSIVGYSKIWVEDILIGQKYIIFVESRYSSILEKLVKKKKNPFFTNNVGSTSPGIPDYGIIIQ
jgi:hypothetical protein